MEEEVIIKILENIGVPVAVCFYTLFRMNQTLRDLTNAINNLTADVGKRLDKIEDKTRELSLELKTLQQRRNL